MKRLMNIHSTKHLFKTEKGYTLIELMVAITIFVIVLGITATIILSSQNIFKNNAEITLGKQVGESVISFVKKDIKYATALNIKQSKELDENYTNALYFQDGELFYLNNDEFSDMYGQDFYSSFKVNAFINIDNIKLAKLTIVVNDEEGKQIYTTSTTLSFKNNQFNQAGFVSEASGDIDLSQYSIYYNK